MNTEIVIVLDRSGSMSSIADDTVGGFNYLIEWQKRVEGDAFVTLFQFDTEYELVHRGIPVADVPPLDFHPRGMTALLDAVSRAIVETTSRLSELGPNKQPDNVIFIIITDGAENSSKEVTREQVKKLVEERPQWDFVYLGANVDAFDEAGGIGIRAGGAMAYTASGQSVQASYAAVTSNLSARRSGTISNMDFTEAQRKEQEEKAGK